MLYSREPMYYRTCLPLLDQSTELVSRHSHSVEVSEYVLSLNVFRDETKLSERLLIILKVGQRHFEHTTF